MKSLYRLFLLLSFTACSVLPAQSLTLDQVLTRMDETGDRLRGMTAAISQKKWTDILEEFDRGETGRFYFLREGGEVYLRKDIEAPQENSLVIARGIVSFYQPKTQQVQRWNLGQNKDKAEFLLLGFGSDKDAMKEAYAIQLVGQEKIGSSQTYVLELTPKSQKVSAYFSKIVLWVDTASWVPVQQKLVEPTRDYLLFQFSNLQLNPRLNKSAFELKLPRGVKVIGQ